MQFDEFYPIDAIELAATSVERVFQTNSKSFAQHMRNYMGELALQIECVLI